MMPYLEKRLHPSSLLFLGILIILFTAGLVLFKMTITGKTVYSGSGQNVQPENLTVTFEAMPIPADAIVVVRVAGMMGQQPLRAFVSREPYSIVYKESSREGFDESITIPFEPFAIPLPSGAHNLSISITYGNTIINQIIVPLQVNPQAGAPPSSRVVAPQSPWRASADYPLQAFFIGFGIISFLVAILIILFHGRIFHLPPDLFKAGNIVNELVMRIEQERAKGHPDAKIVQLLREVASHEQIITAFAKLDRAKIRSYVRSNHEKGYSEAQIRIALERRYLKDVIDEVLQNMG